MMAMCQENVAISNISHRQVQTMCECNLFDLSYLVEFNLCKIIRNAVSGFDDGMYNCNEIGYNIELCYQNLALKMLHFALESDMRDIDKKFSF